MVEADLEGLRYLLKLIEISQLNIFERAIRLDMLFYMTESRLLRETNTFPLPK